MQTTIILLVEQIVTALGGEFKVNFVILMSVRGRNEHVHRCGTNLHFSSAKVNSPFSIVCHVHQDLTFNFS